MNSLLGLLLALGQPASQPASLPAGQAAVPPALVRFQVTLLAIGLCVLIVWIVRRLARPSKFLLRNTPGRPNRLGLIHLAVVAAALVAPAQLALLVLNGLFGNPAVGSVAYQEVSILGLLLAIGPELAIVLWVAHDGFRFGVVNGMGLNLRHWLYDTFRGVAGLLAVWPICQALAWLGVMLVPLRFQEVHPALQFLREAKPGLGWHVVAIVAAFLAAPVVEEIIFRGIVQSALRRWLGRPWPAVLIASAIFAGAHVNVGAQAVPALFALALALGYNYERCGRLWPNILMHMLFNGVNITVWLWPK